MAGVTQSKVCRIVIDVSELITEMLWEEHVENFFPKHCVKTAMVDMESEWQFPFVFSAIDGSHLPIKCPKEGSEAMKQYYSCKNFYSIVLLALLMPDTALLG